MKLAVLQVSDIHLKVGFNQAAARATDLGTAVRSRLLEPHSLLVLYSGDITFSGKKEEFNTAGKFDAALEAALLQEDIQLIGKVAVPGNHDCDFPTKDDARPVAIRAVQEHLDELDLDGELVRQLVRVQDDFFEFEKQLTKSDTVRSEKLSWQHVFTNGDISVLVRCMNTAFVSQLKEQPHQLFFPLEAIGQVPDRYSLVITMFHHPYGWLNPDNARNVKRSIEALSDIVFTGHEHDADSHIKTSKLGENTSYIEGAPLQADIDTGFNLVQIDFQAGTYEVHHFVWSSGRYAATAPKKFAFLRKRSLQPVFENVPEFKVLLKDVGTGYWHPEKKLELGDLFVYPSLRVTSFAKSEATVESENILGFVASKEVITISGAATAGKSSLAKKLYADLPAMKKAIPLLLNGTEIKGGTPPQFLSTVRTAYVSQYFTENFEEFRQLPKEKKILIVDDWHRFRAPKKIRNAFIEAARASFGSLVLLTDDVSFLAQLADASEGVPVENTEYCEIKPFGYRLRSQIIRKWHTLGKELGIDDLELAHKISTSEHLLDSLIGKGIVPSYPLFVVSILQANSQNVQENAAYGSYGHLYQALLTRRMSETGNKKHLGFKYTYLSRVAYAMYMADKQVLSEQEMRAIHRQYEEEYQVFIVQEDELWKELEAAQILVRSGNEFRFLYKYAFYFFVAKFLQEALGDDNSSSSKIRPQIVDMVDSLHDEDNANILIFFIYFTKDRAVIQEILRIASHVFSGEKRATFEDDVEFVNKVMDAPRDLALPSGDTEENRDELRGQMDEDDAEEQSSLPAKKTVYRDDLDDALKIEFAFKSIQVMGQVVKNFPLDLKADLKLALTQESYQLTLRTLGRFLRFFEANFDEMRAHIANLLKIHAAFAKKSQKDLDRKAQESIVAMTELAIYGMVKKLSLAIGIEELKDTYHHVRTQAGEDDIATRLIDISLKFDHFGQLPETDVRDLERRLRENPVAYTILRLLVIEYLSVFPVGHKLTQKMAELFSLRSNTGLLNEKMVRRLPASSN
jgi:hypothetical protein